MLIQESLLPDGGTYSSGNTTQRGVHDIVRSAIRPVTMIRAGTKKYASSSSRKRKPSNPRVKKPERKPRVPADDEILRPARGESGYGPCMLCGVEIALCRMVHHVRVCADTLSY